MVKLVGAMAVVVGLLGAAWAAGVPGTGAAPATATAPATKPGLPACCGDKCRTMVNCCKEDAAGKTTCAMGGSCCVK